MNKETVIRILIRTYPTDWRLEYGDELTQVLALRPLTLSIAGDVAINGIWQRVRYAEAWQLCGAGMALWLIVGTALNSISPLPQWAYNHFFQLDPLMCLAIGYVYVSHHAKGVFAAALAAGKASLVGILPEVLLAILWATNLVHPTILSMSGTPSTIGHGITDLCFRKDGIMSPAEMLAEMLLLVPFNVLIAFLIGLIGAAIAKSISASHWLLRRVR